jgi:hypothetical protein
MIDGGGPKGLARDSAPDAGRNSLVTKTGRSDWFIEVSMTPTKRKRQFVVCVRNTGYPASLELRKIYQALPDADAEAHGLMRVIDESGEDYLYPRTFFVAVDLPQEVATAVRRAAG